MSKRHLPKGQWCCPLCGQEFCTPVSCLKKIKQLREEEARLSASKTLASSDANNSQGGMLMSSQEDRPASDQSPQPEASVREQDYSALAIVPEVFGPCPDCKCSNGKHGRDCSQNIANVI